MDAPPKVQPLFVIFTYRITGLHYTYGRTTLNAAYVGYLYFESHWARAHMWESNHKGSLCWLSLPLESLNYTKLVGFLP